jgi:4-amino-4-deoxy-L-arabinose transferase-like glycosyltransferase
MLTPNLTSHHEHAGTRSWSFSNRALLVSGSVVAILLIGALLRLYALGARGFWGDEIWTAQASLSQPEAILQYYLSYPGPLYFLLGHATLTVLGDVPAEFALRLPSAIASVLSLVVFLALAYRYAGRAVALVGMLLLAVAPYQVWYAQEARFYAVSTLLALLATYALVRALDEPQRNRFWVIFGLSSIANLYNQPLPAALALAGQLALVGAWLIPSAQRRQILVKAFATYVLIVASYWPVIQRVLTTGRMDAFNAQAFLAYQVYDFWATLAGATCIAIDKFAAGGASSWLFVVFCVVGLLAMARQRQWKLLAVTFLPLLAALLAFAAGRPRTGFLVRYVLYLQPLYLLAVAAGVVAAATWLSQVAGQMRAGRKPDPRSLARVAGIATLGFAALLTSISLLQVRQSYSVAKINDWRAIARYLDAHVQPGDLIVGNRWFQSALSWYLQRRDQVTMATDRNESVLDDLSRDRRTWYLQMGPSRGIVSPVLRRQLQAVAPAAWQEPGLDYTSSFFPVSEYLVEARFREGRPAAMARFYDDPPSVEGENPYRILRPGESVQVQLSLPAAGRARFLEVTHYPLPSSALAVTVEAAAPVTVRGPVDTWLEARLPVPPGAGSLVTVRVENVGQRADRLYKLQLRYDEDTP